MKGSEVKKSFFLISILISFFLLCTTFVKSKEKDTLSISLVQRATVKRMEGKEVVYEKYNVKKGDHIWKILRERGLLQRPDFYELLSLIKSMNGSLTDLDLIHPDQTILIPLNIIPLKGYKGKKRPVNELMVDTFSLKDIDFEDYRVKPGDNLTMIAKTRYGVPIGYLYSRYIGLIKKFNPALTNPNLIYPNQVIRLPVYSPEMVRMPIKPYEQGPISVKDVDQEDNYAVESNTLKKQLKDIFNRMGEEWIDTGEHFIPLKSGGQINLKADSFPVLSLSGGMRLIIDIKNDLPEDISKLVESDWEDYGIIHLSDNDNMVTAVDKILDSGKFHKLLRTGEKLEIKDGDIVISLSGNWVIVPSKGKEDMPDKIIVLTILNNESEQTLPVVSTYLKKLGVEIIDYPYFSDRDKIEWKSLDKKNISIEKNADFPLPSLLLKMAGQPFSTRTKIPVYQGQGSGFNITIEADLFFNRGKRDCVIDIVGLSSPVRSLLEKHQFLVLSIAKEKKLNKMTEQILGFLGIPFQSNLHNFFGSVRDEAQNIKLSIQGISFQDQKGKSVFATGKSFPEEVRMLLNQKGYAILDLKQFEE